MICCEVGTADVGFIGRSEERTVDASRYVEGKADADADAEADADANAEAEAEEAQAHNRREARNGNRIQMQKPESACWYRRSCRRTEEQRSYSGG